MNAQQAPTKPIDPFTIFVSASRFRDTSRALAERFNEKLESVLIMPMWIVSAFSLELYLKCLTCMRYGKPAHGHSPKAIFGSLQQPDQESITKEFDTLIQRDAWIQGLPAEYKKIPGINALPEMRLDIHSVLARCDEWFARARYIYEEPELATDAEGHSGTAGMEHVRDAIRNVIMGLQPNWEPTYRLNHLPGTMFAPPPSNPE